MGYPKTIKRPQSYKISHKELRQLSIKKRVLFIMMYQIVEGLITLLFGLGWLKG